MSENDKINVMHFKDRISLKKNIKFHQKCWGMRGRQ